MKLSSKYILFITLIHGTALVMSYFIFKESKLLFIASELVLLLSLYFSHRLYKSLVQPIQLINQGIDAIKDRDFNVKFQGLGQYEIDGLIGVYNHMIDQLREERTEKVQKHFFLEKLINNSPTGVIILNLEGKIATCNPKAQSYIRMEAKDLVGKKLGELINPLLVKIAKLKVGETEVISINGMETFKCHKAQFIDKGFANYFVMIEELTSEKLEIEKLAYGKVIRMMAHEVNNSIGPINSILESLAHYQQYLPEADREDYHEVLKIAQQRNEKLNSFMHNFAKVVRLPQPIKEKTDLRQLVERMSNFMTYQMGEKTIDVQFKFPQEKVYVELDVKQMEQVLINLLKNAMEAIDTKGSIVLQILQEGPSLKIIDSGMGISEDMAQKVFSPFYSSKKNGQGIGLTLSREILLKHGFEFSLKPGEAGGAVFEILF